MSDFGNRRGRHFFLGVVIPVVLAILVVGFFVRLPVSPVPVLGLQLTGSTTNAAGERFHVFSITNRSPTTVFAYMPRVVVQGSSVPIGNAPWSARLRAGESSSLSVPASTNGAPWRLSLYVYNDFDLARRVELFLFRRKYHPHFMDSAWIDPGTSNGVIAIGRQR